MAIKGTTMEFEETRFDAAVSTFLRQLLPEAVDQAVRKMAFDVVDVTARGLNGAGGLPKRIDTGRLRAAWGVALQDGGLPVPASVASSPETLPGDGGATLDYGSSGLLQGIEVRNNVEYAAHVEYGTETMAPGKHLERALRIVRESLPREIGPGSFSGDVARAWEGRKP